MVQKIVLASSNPGKLKEFNQLLGGAGFAVLPQSEFDVVDAEETGLSFVENAIIKARNACEATGLPALADDSGIEVDALDGRPGIYSARFSGPDASNASNNQKLLQDLTNVSEKDRTARYQCVLVYMRHAQDPTPIICQGSWEGRILEAPRGEGGFGYDPLFYVPSHDCAAAELSKEEKSQISHRASALKMLLAELS
ncbi:RdgB/HAM1 family non-canonical purine NTP pyrophosphatase [Gilvimarinus sp. SDUM040013]|uniref:dITP/XTP pyrophosphatase n=1 Tax=Gilvimarinus gilvus TaxID=3058038 RepID=A0ABU4RZ51_9GAMM|nr:RdgB/HAM1 family non-canonical purine NTP pyrophosphatase [Gilvimarinus sp. SDUM040013]MDO3387603.1 RdgB/HAM1 family non-canonical purine NTP pyrophosphatase [Gilvimarinus sp. SDUM040013]MDX6850132.1 RdgB/HAM1 family non-canonical purine NTP pyrophosphatase [Gilvimarinus sp. SDUM040013]